MGESTASILEPTLIDDTTLTSTTVPENDHAAWNSVDTYGLGDRRISAATHRIYESGNAGNLNKDPDDPVNRVANASGVIWWIDVSATNAWKMFDEEKSSQTVAASPLTVVLEPGFINATYAGKIENADTVAITMKDAPGGTVVYSDTISLENSSPPDYYEHFFSPFEQQPDFVIDDLPPYELAELTVTLTNSSGNIKVGAMQIGDLRPLGTTRGGGRPKSKPKSYSYIKIDDFGENEIKRRKSARDMDIEVLVDLDYAITADAILEQARDKARFVIATPSPKYAGLRAFGLVNGEMSYETPGPQHCTLNLKVNGLI